MEIISNINILECLVARFHFVCYFLCMATTNIPDSIFHRLKDQIEDFPHRWSRNMCNAGYLESTTAKRDDCFLSFEWFFEPLLEAAQKGSLPSFGEMITNQGNWADKIIQTARRHLLRGITEDMFIGCFKTFIHSILELVNDGEESIWEKTEAEQFIRLWADALETIIIRDWTSLSQKEADRPLDHVNRCLALEKSKYENVLNSISELVLLMDATGMVLEANRSARHYFKKDPAGIPILGLLGLEGRSLKKMYIDYTVHTPLEITLDGKIYFHCVFVPLHEVSLSSDGYLVVLKDITIHVKQSEILETTVSERTSQLQEMNVTLRTVMKSVDEERESVQENVNRLVTRTLIPALGRIRMENSEVVRTSYLDILENQLT